MLLRPRNATSMLLRLPIASIVQTLSELARYLNCSRPVPSVRAVVVSICVSDKIRSKLRRYYRKESSVVQVSGSLLLRLAPRIVSPGSCAPRFSLNLILLLRLNVVLQGACA
ncbi:unnamed protein product [Periconia digitata]|uniref:Uncharacterized protein n=1 Tax=Periconia digitata TaxID=1303443 RepID=A0A9W4XT65_9PLEO|nr:unnamed protein product [Periconia digitata]